ncbi:hypothetical protein SKAU_G00083100 [Synaphobranchus kaupii]|uniref:Uncharacterized protein n=1 Tax=Synaphobranchus kaupii TaxID=118154 RepID=A0A9Q1J4P1_SYNKA|nr:hypothetical protein SKAU_G00083100 [Synaphobranchus kaupii]
MHTAIKTVLTQSPLCQCHLWPEGLHDRLRATALHGAISVVSFGMDPSAAVPTKRPSSSLYKLCGIWYGAMLEIHRHLKPVKIPVSWSQESNGHHLTNNINGRIPFRLTTYTWTFPENLRNQASFKMGFLLNYSIASHASCFGYGLIMSILLPLSYRQQHHQGAVQENPELYKVHSSGLILLMENGSGLLESLIGY